MKQISLFLNLILIAVLGSAEEITWPFDKTNFGKTISDTEFCILDSINSHINCETGITLNSQFPILYSYPLVFDKAFTAAAYYVGNNQFVHGYVKGTDIDKSSQREFLSYINNSTYQPPQKISPSHSISTQASTCIYCSQVDRNKPVDAAKIAEALIGNNPLSGAYKVMASIYRHCGVLDKPMLKPDSSMGGYNRNINRDFYLKDLEWDGMDKKCKPKISPSYHLGRHTRYSKRDNLISLPSAKTDCSEFVSLALTVTGRKLTPTSSEGSNIGGTRFYYGLSKESSKNSCFENIPAKELNFIQPGDILVSSGAHMVMVENVGQDPLGLEKADIRNASDCSRRKGKLNLNLTYVNSTSDGKAAASRMKAQDHYEYAPAMKALFDQLFTRACLNKFGVNDTQVTEVQTGKKSKKKQKPSDFGIVALRHMGDQRPECMFEEKPRISGEECIASCNGKINKMVSDAHERPLNVGE